MEVIVKSSPKIEIEFATKVVKVGDGSKINVDSALSTTSENPVQNKVVTEELGRKVEGYTELERVIDDLREYQDDMGESITIPINVSDTSSIYVYYLEPDLGTTLHLVLNTDNDYYSWAWNESQDYCYQAKYSNGILLLEEPNNYSIGLFERVEVYDARQIDERLMPGTIARVDYVM